MSREKAEEVRSTLLENWKSISKTVPSHVDAERLGAIAVAAVRSDDSLSRCSTSSLVTCIVACAQLGIEPGDNTQRAYLIPRGGECTLMIGYRGLIELAYRSGTIESIDAQVIYDGDEYQIDLGTDPRVVHRPTLENRGEMVGVYAVIHVRGASVPIVEVMDLKTIDKIRRAAGSRSPAWRDWPEEMAKKSVIKRPLKRVPLSSDLRRALAIDDEHDARGIAVEDVMPEVTQGWAGMADARDEDQHHEEMADDEADEAEES